MNKNELRSIIESVLNEINTNGVAVLDKPAVSVAEAKTESNSTVAENASPNKNDDYCEVIEDGFLDDISAMDIIEQYLYEEPYDKEGFMELKKFAPCRLAIGKAGARYKTLPLLQFRSAHSAAQDAVFSEVDEDIIKELNLETYKSRCDSKDTYLTRPDLGRRFDEESAKRLAGTYEKNMQVCVFVADGLSCAAVEANTKDVLSSLMQGLKSTGLSVGTPFFVQYGRVGVMDEVSEITGADVVCILVGERPGLITATSMSAYITYKGTIGMPEARRTVVSNIHSQGTIPAEAGAHVAEIIRKIYDNKASGTDLKL